MICVTRSDILHTSPDDLKRCNDGANGAKLESGKLVSVAFSGMHNRTMRAHELVKPSETCSQTRSVMTNFQMQLHELMDVSRVQAVMCFACILPSSFDCESREREKPLVIPSHLERSYAWL